MVRRPIHLAFASDASCAVALGVAILSLLRVQPPHIRYVFHVLDGGIPARVQKQIEQLAADAQSDLHFVPVVGLLDDLPCGGRFPATVYHRFLLPELLPSDIERVLYLDADVLACRDVTPVYDTDLGGRPLGAPVWQVVGSYDSEMGGLLRGFCTRMGLPEDGLPYFYSSQLVMDLVTMRREQIGALLIETARMADPAALAWPDQDVLNAALRGRIAVLPAACNVIPLFTQDVLRGGSAPVGPRVYGDEELRAAWADPMIIHFAACKPNALRGHQDDYDERFFTLWKQSPWRGRIPYVPEGIRELASRSPRLAAWLMAPAGLLSRCDFLLRGYGAALMAADRLRKCNRVV